MMLFPSFPTCTWERLHPPNCVGSGRGRECSTALNRHGFSRILPA